MKKEKEDPYKKQREILVDKIMKDKSLIFFSSAGACHFNRAELENDPIVTHKYVAYITTNNGKYNIHGWGNSKKEATVNSLKHIESMGTTILDYMKGWSPALEDIAKTKCLKQRALGEYKPKVQKKLKLM